MPSNRPTLPELKSRITSDLGTRLVGTPTLLSRAFITVIGTVAAGAFHMVYAFIAWVLLQIFPETAEAPYLLQIAARYGLFPKAATYGTGNVTLTGAPGSVLTALNLDGTQNAIFQRSDGALYNLVSDVTFTGSGSSVSATGTVIAQVVGSASECEAGISLTLLNPAAGVSSSVVVATGGIVGGADPETPASLLARLLFRIANPSRGGNDADYVFWAESQSGVTRAWTYPKWMGPGTVGVTFVLDGQATTIIPNSGQLTAMAAYINTQKPDHADLYVFMPTAVPLNPNIHLNPDTPALRAAVLANLQDLLTDEANPSTPANPSSELLLSHIEDAVGEAVGAGDFTIVSPTGNVSYGNGQVGTMGTPTWS